LGIIAYKVQQRDIRDIEALKWGYSISDNWDVKQQNWEYQAAFFMGNMIF
jgi:hypothetical protein